MHSNHYLGVAQPGSASGLGPEGREFESLHRDQSLVDRNTKIAIITTWRDGAVVARLAHTQQVGGSIPSPATNFMRNVMTDTIRLYHSQEFPDGDVYSTEKSFTTTDMNLTQILDVVEEWLRGAGFHFKGTLDIVED